MKLKERAQLYNKSFPNYPPLVTSQGWLYGVWFIGNDYRNRNEYYGEYPPSYLDRILSIFPDKTKRLHLFSGTVKDPNATIFDIWPDLKPDVIGNAHKLSEYFPENSFNLVLADPPYSEEDADHYGLPMVSRSKVLAEATKIVETEGYIVWLDQVLPMYRSSDLFLVGAIGLVRSTNHRFRVVSIFRKIPQGEYQQE